ncbi:MAG: hypothetical protein WCF85_02435 [Rhodospirillaceae bacterium]
MTGGSKIWTVRGIPAELQSAVSTAAKSARQTLGEWTAAALLNALSGGTSPTVGATPADNGQAARLEALEARLGSLERRTETLDTRGERTHFRVDGLEHRLEGIEGRLANPERSPRGSDSTGNRPGLPPRPSATEAADSIDGPFTRGLGSRKRLTAAGEEELQRLVAAGVDDAAIAARLGIHKRIVWARRLTESGGD